MERHRKEAWWSWLKLMSGLWLLAATAGAAQAQDGAPGPQPDVVGWVELSKPLRDAPAPFAWMPHEADTLRGVIAQLRHIASQPHYLGVVIYLDQPVLSMSEIHELSGAIQQIRQAGRKVLVFSECYDLPGYLLACSADMILLQHKGLIQIAGLQAEEIYLAGLFDKIGMKADLIQIGKYKGAADPLTRTGPTQEWSVNVDSMLDDLYDQIVRRVSRARGLTAQQVEQVFAECWTLSDQQYVQRRLVDRLATRELMEVTGEVFGEHFTWDDVLGGGRPVMRPDNPFAVFQAMFQSPRPRATRPSLAIIHMQGAIASGESRDPGFFGGGMIGSRTMVRALRTARDDKLIKGVVLRVDSPGGSALASEVIWQAIRELAAEKPVFVSIASVAASGGYYVACAGDRLYASPTSLVGSIGVVGGKFILGGLYEKIGLSVHRRHRGPMADIFNSVEPFSVQQRAALLSSMQRTYDLFVDRVKTGRGPRLAEIGHVAEGRIFTGRQAVANGLVDQVGGIEVALAEMAEKVGLTPGTYDVLNLPPPRSLAEFLQMLFDPRAAHGGAAQHDWIRLMEQMLGPQTWRQAQAALEGWWLLRQEPALTLLPTILVFR